MDTAAESASAPPTPAAHLGLAAPAVTLGLLSLTYTLSFFDRMLMIVLGETIKGEFHLSDKQLSILTGAAFVIIYGVVGVGAGWALDRYSRKRILGVALCLWSVATMACGMAGNFVQLAIARAGVGIGEAANVPAALAIIADIYPPARRPMASAIFYTGGMAGILASFLFGTWVAARYGWRSAFFAAGPPGILLAACIFIFCREPKREGRRCRGIHGRRPSFDLPLDPLQPGFDLDDRRRRLLHFWLQRHDAMAADVLHP